MADPLDPLPEAYEVAAESLAATRQAARTPATATLLVGSRLRGRTTADVDALVAVARRELDAQTVLFLYATFESTLRDDLTARSALLALAPGPHPTFGRDLAAWFADLCNDVRMDGMTRLYAPAAGPALSAVIGNVRKYRQCLAHGRRGTAPPAVNPRLAYARLTQFLQACGLA